MNRKIMSLMLVLLFGILISSCTQQEEKHPGSVKKITFAVETSFLTAPVWIAENKGYFQEEGLNIKIKEFDSGKAALAAMLGGEDLDMVTVAQTPVMFNSFNRKDYAIIAAMVCSDKDVKLLARKDRGIENSSDLRGKKIGVTKGSTGHFYLGLFLTHSDLKLSNVDIIDIGASALPQALRDGRVDAICAWEPHILNAGKLLGENAVFLPPKGGANIFREDFYFVVNKNFMENNPEALKRFLKAIQKGEEFIQKNKKKSIGIVSRRLKVDKELVASVWDDFDFQLLLDQAMLMTLEDEARWAIENKLTKATEVPNYLDYVYLDALEDVKADAVTIIR